MERLYAVKQINEAVSADLAGFEVRLAADDPTVAAPLAPLKTRIFAQRLAPYGRSLVGERRLVLQNDQPCEALLVEGVWVTRQGDRCWMFYAANDFSTAAYGICVAVAHHPLGPYRKLPGPILGSSRD